MGRAGGAGGTVGPEVEEFGSDVSLSASGSKALILGFGFRRRARLRVHAHRSVLEPAGAPIPMPYKRNPAGPSTCLKGCSQPTVTRLVWPKFATDSVVYTDTPALSTGVASELGTGTATLKGTVYPAGEKVTVLPLRIRDLAAYGTSKRAPRAGRFGCGACLGEPSTVSRPGRRTTSASVVTAAGTFYSADGRSRRSGLATRKNEEPSKPAKVTLGSVSATASGGTGEVTVGSYGANAASLRCRARPAAIWTFTARAAPRSKRWKLRRVKSGTRRRCGHMAGKAGCRSARLRP